MDEEIVRELCKTVQSCITDCGAMQELWFEDERAITEDEFPLITEILNHFNDLTEKLCDVMSILRNAVFEQRAV